MKPPENSIILCVDEKSQIQVLERSQTVDYLPHGTTTLFAALDVLTGNVIGECKERHTSEDYISFLKKVDSECDKKKELHIVSGNL